MILSVEQGSAAEGLGVHEGDHLVAVNGVDTSTMGPDKAARTLIRSDWPRVLAFAVAEVRQCVLAYSCSCSTRLLAHPCCIERSYKCVCDLHGVLLQLTRACLCTL
jgi:PDZ domain